MTTKENTTMTSTVFAAWASVMGDVQGIRKGQRNAQQGYTFRGIDAVMNAVGPVLREHHVAVVPVEVDATWRDTQTTQGKAARECTVRVTYRVYGPAGDHFDIASIGESMDAGDKGAPKAMSVALRTALLQALCVPTDDPDPDSQSYERAIPVVRHDSQPEVETPLKRLGRALKTRGVEKDEALALFSRVVGREVTATADLTSAEQTSCAEALEAGESA